jgi:mannosyltransferase OCH1-like enzyme
MTDEKAKAYVKSAFTSRPDIIDTYLRLTIPILQTDLLRYLILFDQGGIWSDLDVSCESVPIDDWIPLDFRHEAEVVVGWEYDKGWEKLRTRQFASWTIMAKSRSKHMQQVIEDIVQTLRWKMEDHKVPIENITTKMIGDVVEFSGPRRLTRSIFKSLDRSLNRTVEMGEVSNIVQPKLIGNILVMPGQSFAAAANRYTIWEEWELSPTLVTHHYAGTWKNNKGGE